MIYRSFWILILALSGTVASQAPEFAQQYRQRLGGALDELRAVVADFDRDAAANGLDRNAALETYQRSSERFLNDRGLSMSQTLARLETLEAQRRDFEEFAPLLRPVALLRHYDERLVEGTMSIYRPAVPTTTDGAVWAGAGALIGAILVSLLHRLARLVTGRPASRRSEERRHRNGPFGDGEERPLERAMNRVRSERDRREPHFGDGPRRERREPVNRLR